MKITDCTDDWDRELLMFNYTIRWTIPQFWAYGNGIISRFVLTADEINSGLRTRRFYGSETFEKIANKTSYKHTWTNIKPLEDLYSYELKVWIDPRLDIYSFKIVKKRPKLFYL